MFPIGFVHTQYLLGCLVCVSLLHDVGAWDSLEFALLLPQNRSKHLLLLLQLFANLLHAVCQNLAGSFDFLQFFGILRRQSTLICVCQCLLEPFNFGLDPLKGSFIFLFILINPLPPHLDYIFILPQTSIQNLALLQHLLINETLSDFGIQFLLPHLFYALFLHYSVQSSSRDVLTCFFLELQSLVVQEQGLRVCWTFFFDYLALSKDRISIRALFQLLHYNQISYRNRP